MEGSRYPDGVQVDSTSLKRTETTKSDQIKRNRELITSRGIYSGGVISQNAVNTDRIDITAFSGFTPNGEWIEETAATANVALADSTLGTVNVVFAMYTETATHNSPHETDGETHPTFNEASYTMKVLTQADFDNTTTMPPTDDNLANDALDRALVIGKVTGEGVGVAVATFVYSAPYEGLKYSADGYPAVISGVTILSVDPDCPVGSGTLKYDLAAPQHIFYWKSYGASGFSAAGTLTADGELTLTDADGFWIKILVNVSQAPLGLTLPYSESIPILDLYAQTIDRFTGEDVIHRSLQGTGILGANNPHALALDDLGGSSLSFLDEHQDVQHSNGIWRGSNASTFSASLSLGASTGDVISIVSPPAGSLYYINGSRLNGLTPTSFVFDAAGFTAGTFGVGEDYRGTKLYEMYVDDSEVLIPYRRATYPDNAGAFTRNVTGTWLIDMSDDHPSGSYDLEYIVSAGTDFTLTWGGGQPVAGKTPTAGSGVVGRVIRAYAPNGTDWVDVYLGDDNAVGDKYLPTAGTSTDTITVYAAPDLEEHMKILATPYWYDQVGARGILGFDPTVVIGSRYTLDKRAWGNLSEVEVADSALSEMDYFPNVEYNKSGIVLGRNSTKDFLCEVSAGLVVTLNGGTSYCRGKRLEVDGSDFTLVDNDITVLWVDTAGVVQQTLFSATEFGSDLDQTLEWLIGHPQHMNPDAVEVYQGAGYPTPERGVPLWLITTLTGNVTRIEGIYRGVGANVGNWTVGQGGTATTPDMSVAASFSNLRTAFAYAKLEAETYNISGNAIEVEIVGPVLLDVAVTQPAYVNVRGSWSASAMVTESLSPYTAAGVWLLSDGCTVSNVTITGTTSPVFQLNDDVVLDHISHTYTGTGFAYFISNLGTPQNPTIKNCKLKLNRGFTASSGATTFTGMRFIDNYVYSDTPTSTETLMYMTLWNDAVVSGNKFFKDMQSGVYTERIVEIDNCDEMVFTNNVIRSNVADEGSALWVNSCDNLLASSNIMENVLYGAYLYGSGTGAVLKNNIISAAALGIYCIAAGSTLEDNKINVSATEEQALFSIFGGDYGAMCMLLEAGCDGSIIRNNEMFLGTPASTLYDGSASFCAIDASDLEILGNTLRQDYNGAVSGSGNAYCAYLEDLLGTWSFSNNIVYNDIQNGVPALTDSYGVLVKVYDAGVSRSEGSIIGNVIYGSNYSGAISEFDIGLSGVGTPSSDNRADVMNNLVKLYQASVPGVNRSPVHAISADTFILHQNNYYETHLSAGGMSLTAF